MKVKNGKILLFSDTHLSHIFNEAKFKLLSETIRQANHVIIIGDLVDSWLTTADQFVNSEWKKIFPLLKEKNTIYIYGNHDDKPFLQNHYLKFADEYTGEYYFKSGLTEFKIAHGHNEVPLSAYPWPVAKYFRIAEKIDKRTTFTKLMKSIERFYIKKFGILAIANSEKLHHRNELTKQYKDPAYFLICGDTHCPELDLKNKYANTGFIDNGFASYITVEN